MDMEPYLLRANSSFQFTTPNSNELTAVDPNDPHCPRDALTNSYGWFVQLLLASLAFMLLIGEFLCNYFP